ncbi:MAG: maleylpyruvate isomerase family mycothiol-dependent enzyme [Chloroflexi bacterium]|nr:maleylpyruvate isomerase family mycothiol-dependent enzyme [Chloroflexota bacterium]
MNDKELIDMMESVCGSIGALCATFTEQEWKTPTDCPGWSAQDQVSHLIGIESRILGRPEPDHTPKDLSHIKNDFGAQNEVGIDWRRSWPGAKVLEEFQEVTGERMKALRALSADDFDEATQTPIGPGKVRDLIGIRIFDFWVHEQDIRRAVGRPGNYEGSIAEHSMGRLVAPMPYVVGKKAQAPDGATVVFDITGQLGQTIAIGMDGKIAKLLDSTPESSTVRLIMDTETFACLCCGRWEPAEVLASGKVQIQGDRTLGEAIVNQMNFMI